MYLPTVFPISLKEPSSQKIKGKWGSLTHTGVDAISSSGLKSRYQGAKYMPLEPMKYGPEQNIKSRPSLFEKRNTK